MGINVDSSLIVGCSYGELEEFFKSKNDPDLYDGDIGAVIEEYFEYASPYYDSSPEDWFIGYKIPNLRDVTNDWFAEVVKIAWKFEELTGVKPRIRGGANVW